MCTVACQRSAAGCRNWEKKIQKKKKLQLRLVQCIHIAAWFVRQVTQQRRRHRVRSTKYGFNNTYRTAVLQYDIYCTGHSGNYVWYNIYYSLVIVRDKSCGITATGGEKKNPQTPAYYEITIENGCTADF